MAHILVYKLRIHFNELKQKIVWEPSNFQIGCHEPGFILESDIKRLHLDLFSKLWENFRLHLGLPLTLLLTIWKTKANICSTFAFEFFLKFWTFYCSIQSNFTFSFQKYNFFWNRTKIDIFSNWSLMELFFWRRNSFFLRT